MIVCLCFVGESPGGKTISEIKASSIAACADQALSQVIVFSLLQKQKHPEFVHHLIPNILISPEEFQILMYDSVNDILLGSYACPLFDHIEKTLLTESVIVLWMVLHYRKFCGGMPVHKLAAHFKGIDLQSHLEEKADSKWCVYAGSLRENVNHFPLKTNKIELHYKMFMHCRKIQFQDD